MDGKTVLITGAGSGIGRAAALAFSQRGARVVVVDVRSATAEETAQLVIDGGGSAHAFECDVGSAEAVDAMFAKAVASCGRIDFAFNNAGVSQAMANLADVSLDEWHRIMRVNVDGVWHCMRNELTHMAALGAGVIVNTASTAGLRSIKGFGAYSTSKHAVVGLTKSAAIEYALSGIRVNAICPGGVKTPMVTEGFAALDPEEAAEILRRSEVLHPMGRLGEAEEVADAAVFLCSEQARFVTGVCLPVDGGYTAV